MEGRGEQRVQIYMWGGGRRRSRDDKKVSGRCRSVTLVVTPRVLVGMCVVAYL